MFCYGEINTIITHSTKYLKFCNIISNNYTPTPYGMPPLVLQYPPSSVERDGWCGDQLTDTKR